ncbi:MAG: hypothetical protein U5P10_08255 [Spirochaetia bacterium]|nr:hypothetical protein [Spirochaetia bacterium]
MVAYQYAIGTSPESADTMWWKNVTLKESAYLVGAKGSSPGNTTPDSPAGVLAPAGKSGRDVLEERVMEKGRLESDYLVEFNDLGLEEGESDHLRVRAVNGTGMQTPAWQAAR